VAEAGIAALGKQMGCGDSGRRAFSYIAAASLSRSLTRRYWPRSVERHVDWLAVWRMSSSERGICVARRLTCPPVTGRIVRRQERIGLESQ
jgi:hypothetical protein